MEWKGWRPLPARPMWRRALTAPDRRNSPNKPRTLVKHFRGKGCKLKARKGPSNAEVTTCIVNSLLLGKFFCRTRRLCRAVHPCGHLGRTTLHRWSANLRHVSYGGVSEHFLPGVEHLHKVKTSLFTFSPSEWPLERAKKGHHREEVRFSVNEHQQINHFHSYLK